MRPPVDTIVAPRFPGGLSWVNVAPLRMEQQAARPVLVEFWDFCRPASLRTLPYVMAWHERYAGAGLRVISVHSPGFPPGHEEDAVRAAVARLGITHPVVLDTDFDVWRAYENPGWPARYLFAPRLVLADVHFGEGGYEQTERAIQELLGVEEPLAAPLRPADADDALLAMPTPEREGAYCGPYAAGEVWLVVDGRGEVRVNGTALAVEHPGAVRVIAHERHTEGVLEVEPGPGVRVLATSFAAGPVAVATDPPPAANPTP